MASSVVSVAPLEKGDVQAVRQLLIDGLTERWGIYDAHFNPDLDAFPESYSNSTVLVAKESGHVVGTGTLRILSERRAEIVRMSVNAQKRRTGIGGRVVRGLIDTAIHRGIREVVLVTETSWISAVEFYLKHGFQKTHEQNSDTFFVYPLSARSTEL